MKFLLLAVCIVWEAVCAPSHMFMEFDIRHAPAEAAKAIPAGAPIGTLEVLLPVDAQRLPVGGPVRGFIKQEILEPNGRDTKDVFYLFGFDQPEAALAAPAAPVAPVAPAAPVAPVVPAALAPAAPAAPVVPIIATSAPVAKPSGDDDDDDDDDDDEDD